MDEEIANVLRPTGGTKRFRRNCRLIAGEGAIAVRDRTGRTTRFGLDGSQDAPTKMVAYLQREPFMVVDGLGRGLITSDDILWDSDEQARFCDAAKIPYVVENEEPPAMRRDGVRLEEPAWLRRYVVSAPYVFAAGVVLAPIGRAFNLPLWLMLPFLPWLLMYAVVRATGYFAPRRVGPMTIRVRREAAERAERRRRRNRKRKATTP